MFDARICQNVNSYLFTDALLFKRFESRVYAANSLTVKALRVNAGLKTSKIQMEKTLSEIEFEQIVAEIQEEIDSFT